MSVLWDLTVTPTSLTQPHANGPVDIDQLAQVAALTKDLDDPDIMSNAWS